MLHTPCHISHVLLLSYQLYQSVEDKEEGSAVLLAVAGHLMQLLVNALDQTVQTALLSQTSPNIISWMKKQVIWKHFTV